MSEPPGEWSGYQRLVLSKLEDLKHGVSQLDAKLDKRIAEVEARVNEVADTFYSEIAALKVKVAMLEVKSGVWGAIAGLLAVALFVGYDIIKGG